MEYMELQAAADKATAAWLADDSAENHATMVAADDALLAAKAAGLNLVTVRADVVDEIMARSVFGDADRARAARHQEAAPMFSAVIDRLSRDYSRAEAREVIRTVLDENSTIGMTQYRFMADHLMARLGYGGGF